LPKPSKKTKSNHRRNQEKQQETRNIDAQIENFIRAAIVAANKKTAAAKAKANPKTTTAAETKATETSTKIVLTPKARWLPIISAPTRKIAVAGRERFCVVALRRPTASGIQIAVVHNSGVEITTDQGAMLVRCLAEKSSA
jgi:hypothetical protein